MLSCPRVKSVMRDEITCLDVLRFAEDSVVVVDYGFPGGLADANVCTRA
jgi:hypothetical protein